MFLDSFSPLLGNVLAIIASLATRNATNNIAWAKKAETAP